MHRLRRHLNPINLFVATLLLLVVLEEILLPRFVTLVLACTAVVVTFYWLRPRGLHRPPFDLSLRVRHALQNELDEYAMVGGLTASQLRARVAPSVKEIGEVMAELEAEGYVERIGEEPERWKHA